MRPSDDSDRSSQVRGADFDFIMIYWALKLECGFGNDKDSLSHAA